MENNQWFYSNIHKQLLYMQFCEQPEFCKALAYLLTFKEHQNLNVIPHTFSIELSNADIQIFIIHTVFFQQKEYPKFKNLKNVYFVSFDRALAKMHEFSEMINEIKFISKNMLMSTVEALTENKLINAITQFKENNGV